MTSKNDSFLRRFINESPAPGEDYSGWPAFDPLRLPSEVELEIMRAKQTQIVASVSPVLKEKLARLREARGNISESLALSMILTKYFDLTKEGNIEAGLLDRMDALEQVVGELQTALSNNARSRLDTQENKPVIAFNPKTKAPSRHYT